MEQDDLAKEILVAFCANPKFLVVEAPGLVDAAYEVAKLFLEKKKEEAKLSCLHCNGGIVMCKLVCTRCGKTYNKEDFNEQGGE